MDPTTRRCAVSFAARFWGAIPAGGGTTILAPSAMTHNNAVRVFGALLLMISLLALTHDPSRVRARSSGTQGDSPPNTQESKDTSLSQKTLGQSPADMDVTRRIRRAVLDDGSLSTYAHNVKIITRNGQVTLRGPVRTTQEKAAVEEKAASVVGRENVKNEIEVSPGRDP